MQYCGVHVHGFEGIFVNILPAIAALVHVPICICCQWFNILVVQLITD